MAERGFIPAFFAHRSPYGTPTVGILLSSLGIIAMLTMELVKIIELLNAIYCMGQLLEFAAFIHLRIKAPSLVRPFRVPIPTWACVLGLTPAIFFLSCLLVLPVINRNWLVMAYCTVALAVGAALYPLMTYLREKGICYFSAT